MLDSPYVRRVAIVLLRLRLPFEHRPISLFRHIDAFRRYNSLLKAPTLIAGDGTVLMDSTLIIEHLASISPDGAHLSPSGASDRLAALASLGVSLLVCEKAVQAHYERALRPPEKRHEPWIARVHDQLLTGLDQLEAQAGAGEEWLFERRLTLADITLACAFRFTQDYLGDIVEARRYKALASYCARAESLPEFRAAPPIDGVTAPAPLAPQ